MADDPTVTDPETDPAVEGDPTGETEPEGTEEDEYTPPTREELDALKAAHAQELADAKAANAKTAAALKKANNESAARRRELAELQQQHEDEDTKAKREATEAALAALKPVAIKAEAKSAFLAAGASADKAPRLIRLLDLSKIDVDGETVIGLDEQVEDLRDEFPELFTPSQQDPEPKTDPTPKPKPAAVEVGARKPGPQQLSPLEALTAQLQRSHSK